MSSNKKICQDCGYEFSEEKGCSVCRFTKMFERYVARCKEARYLALSAEDICKVQPMSLPVEKGQLKIWSEDEEE